METKTNQKASEALTRAATNQSTMNYATILNGFAAKGIPMDQIEPRQNVFTFMAWRALGRRVKKGEHGIKVFTFVPMEVETNKTGDNGEQTKKLRVISRPWTTTVFHVSQTEVIGEIEDLKPNNNSN